MVLEYSITQHAEAYPSKVLAAEGGKHIYNILLTNACDNGNFIARNAWLSFDLYSEKAATTFAGVVREKAANGNYYVEVVTPGDALFVCMVDDHAEEWTNTWKNARPYNAAGSVVRAYELAVGDILEISVEGFTAEPTVGDSVELSGKKLAKA